MFLPNYFNGEQFANEEVLHQHHNSQFATLDEQRAWEWKMKHKCYKLIRSDTDRQLLSTLVRLLSSILAIAPIDLTHWYILANNWWFVEPNSKHVSQQRSDLKANWRTWRHAHFNKHDKISRLSILHDGNYDSIRNKHATAAAVPSTGIQLRLVNDGWKSNAQAEVIKSIEPIDEANLAHDPKMRKHLWLRSYKPVCRKNVVNLVTKQTQQPRTKWYADFVDSITIHWGTAVPAIAWCLALSGLFYLNNAISMYGANLVPTVKSDSAIPKTARNLVYKITLTFRGK